MEVTRVFDILDLLQERPKPDILAAKVNKQWQQISSKDFKHKAHCVASGLLHLGLKPGDKIAFTIDAGKSAIVAIDVIVQAK